MASNHRAEISRTATKEAAQIAALRAGKTAVVGICVAVVIVVVATILP